MLDASATESGDGGKVRGSRPATHRRAIVRPGGGPTPTEAVGLRWRPSTARWSERRLLVLAPEKGAAFLDPPGNFFQGSKQWTIRLITTHRNGSQREARFNLKLGQEEMT